MDIYEQIVELRPVDVAAQWHYRSTCADRFPRSAPPRCWSADDGSIVGTIWGGCVEADVWQAAREVMESEKTTNLKFD